METYDAIMTLRSMRRLTDDPPVTEADIEGMQDYETRYPQARNVGAGEDVEVIVEE